MFITVIMGGGGGDSFKVMYSSGFSHVSVKQSISRF